MLFRAEGAILSTERSEVRDLRKKVRIAVIVLLALVFTVSLAMFVRQSLTYRAGQET